MRLTKTQRQLLHSLLQLQKKLSAFKAEESELRDSFVSTLPTLSEGSNYFDVTDRHRLCVKQGYTNSINEKIVPAVKEELPDKLVDRLIVKGDPKFRKKEYDKLTAEQKKIFDACLVRKPSKPTLQLQEIKDET